MEKRGLSKRSQSEVITIVLIILLVIFAVFIVYVAVRNIIKSGAEQAGDSSSKFDIALIALKPCFVDGANYIPVSRKAGAGNISEIRIIFKDSTGKSVCPYSNKTDVPKELETVVYNVSLAGCDAVSYEVYPIIISNGKEVIGMKAIEIGGGCAGGGGGSGNTVACSSNTQCETSGFSGNPFCNGGDIRQKNVTWTCNSPATTSSSCSSVTVFLLNKSCNGKGCQVIGGIAVCNPAISGCSAESECGTDGFTGSLFCNVGNLYQNYTNYTCSSSNCSSVVTSRPNKTCTAGCSNGACNSVGCSSNSDCGQDEYTGSPFCSQNKVNQSYIVYTCSSSNCSSVIVFKQKQSCSYGCISGTCKPTPNPSLPECNDADVNGNGVVDSADFGLVISGWGKVYCGYEDVNGDEYLDLSDWMAVKHCVQSSDDCPPTGQCRQRELTC